MTPVQQLPRIVMTWGLMFLTVIAGGVRPSCICADGTLCLLCPKLMATHAVSSLAEPTVFEPTVADKPCSSNSCCGRRVAATKQSKSSSVCEWTTSACDGSDCLAIQSAPPVIVPVSEDSARCLDSNLVPAQFANAELVFSRESTRPTRGTHRTGPPPDLIVLYQRWLI